MLRPNVSLMLAFSSAALSCAPASLAADATDTPPLNRTYGLVIDCAEGKLRHGALDDALLLFDLADKMSLHETPNYDALIGVAEVHCRKGDSLSGVRILQDYMCMLDVESGIRSCRTPQAEAPLNAGNPQLTEECFARMCNEILIDTYDNPTQELLTVLEQNRSRARQVEALCLEESG